MNIKQKYSFVKDNTNIQIQVSYTFLILNV